MVAGEKEAVWIHHDRRPSVEMPARGLLNEGTSRDGDRDNERPLDSWSFGQHYLFYHIYDQVHGLSTPLHGAQKIGPQFASKQPFINLQKCCFGPKILVSNFENSVVSSSEF